jgi:uncharacterized protein (DUF58 family)
VKRALSPSSVALIMAGGLFLFSVGQRLDVWLNAGPQVRLVPAEIDLGIVKLGRPVTSTFSLQNAGGSPLIIRKLESTCQCTAPTTPIRELASRTSEPVTVTFKASRLGSYLQRVIVETNDPKEEIAVFTLRARVVTTASTQLSTAVLRVQGASGDE